MGFFENLGFSKKSNYKSLFPGRVEGLTDKQKRKFDLIASGYKRLSKTVLDTAHLQEAFFKRFERAKKNSMNINLFFQVEEDAFLIYQKKLEQNNQKFSNQQSTSRKPQTSSYKKKTYEVKDDLYKNYPRIFIHENANPTIERLYGALIDYERKFSNGLLQSIRVITEQEFQQIVYAVIYGLEDFTRSKGKLLPFIFSQYSFELDKESRNRGHIEKEIFTKISIIFDKVSKLVLWSKRINLESISKNPFSYFIVDNVRLDLHDFFNSLEEESKKMIDAFDLHSSI